MHERQRHAIEQAAPRLRERRREDSERTRRKIRIPHRLLRIDADAYDGVLDTLEGAYHRLSPGGFVIIDDWHLGGACAAVWKSTSVSGALSHLAAMTRPSWLCRAVRNRHRHAIEQASRRWRGGQRVDSANAP